MSTSRDRPSDNPTAPTAPPATAQQLAVLDDLPIAMLLVDEALMVYRANPAATALLGEAASVTDLLDRSLRSDPAVDWKQVLGGVLSTGQPDRLAGLTVADSGDERQGGQSVAVQIHPQPFGGAAALGVFVHPVVTDAELRRQLAVAQSLAAVGQLAARVAHELNNPLDGSLRYINLCRRLLGDQADRQAADYLERAATGLRRMARIVGELLAFSRSHHDYRESGDIATVVEEAIRIHRDQADRQQVVIAAGFHDGGLPAPEGGKLLQVCSNLIKNALDAMPSGGCLTITTGCDRDSVMLRFEDTGVGVGSAADIERLFDPFYTTKPPGEGTGLGLAICRDYMRQLGGDVVARPGEEGGAVFTVTLPVSLCRPAPSTHRVRPSAPADTAGGTHHA